MAQFPDLVSVAQWDNEVFFPAGLAARRLFCPQSETLEDSQDRVLSSFECLHFLEIRRMLVTCQQSAALVHSRF